MSWASYSPSWEMQSIAEVSGESPGIRFKSCHYKSPSAKQFVQQLITAVKQRSHGAILRTEGKAVATGERRLGDKSKANMPKLIEQKRLNLPPILAAWQEKTERRLWMDKYVRASAGTSHAEICHLPSVLARTGGVFSCSLEAGYLHSCPPTVQEQLSTDLIKQMQIDLHGESYIYNRNGYYLRSGCFPFSWYNYN